MMQIAFKFLLLLLVVPILCQDPRVEKAFVKGINFQGEITLSGNILRIDILQFSSGKIYMKEISNQLIEKEKVRFMVFKNTEELFAEMKDNEKMSIVDGNILVPLEVTYKRRRVELNLEIPISQRRFQSEEEKLKTLLLIIEAINNEKARMQRDLIPRRIEFKPDWTNKNIYKFEISEGGKRIKKLDGGETFYNNAAVLPKTGIHYFQIRVIQSQYRWILVGICAKNIKNTDGIQAHRTPFAMGYAITTGYLYDNGQNYAAASPTYFVFGQTVIGLEIDMNKKWFTVYIDRKLLFATQIRKLLTEQDIYPYVTLNSPNDTIEFVE